MKTRLIILLSLLSLSVRATTFINSAATVTNYFDGAYAVSSGSNIDVASIPSTAFDATVLPYFMTNTFNNISNGTITTLSPGASATLSMTKSNGMLLVNMGIPQGAVGATGTTGSTGATGTTGSQGTQGNPGTNAAAHQFFVGARTLNSSFIVSSNTDSIVKYSVDVASSLSLSGGTIGGVLLEVSTNNSTWTFFDGGVNANVGALTIGLNTVQTNTVSVGGCIPAGYWIRIKTTNILGSPLFNSRAGNETWF